LQRYRDEKTLIFGKDTIPLVEKVKSALHAKQSKSFSVRLADV